MCDRKHTGACWRDPMCDVALPSRLKPALLKSIDEDRLANASWRLGESIKTRRQPASGMLCRAMSCPDQALMDAALQVLCYLYIHRKLGLRYERNCPAAPDGYTDSDWAIKHSTSALWLNISVSLPHHNLGEQEKQQSVALSSCEADIMAASEAAKEAVYLREFLSDLGFGDDKPTRLRCDNQGAIDMTYYLQPRAPSAN